MKKIIWSLIFVLMVLTSCWENKIETNKILEWSNPIWESLENAIVAQEISIDREVTIDDNFTLVSIEDASEYKFISKNNEWDEVEFTFKNKTVNADKYLINNIHTWWFWNDTDVKICYRSEIKKQISYNISHKDISFDDFQYDSSTKKWKWILKIDSSNRQDELWELLLKQWYFVNSNSVNPNLLCKCKNWHYGNNDVLWETLYRFSSINDDGSFTLLSQSWTQIKFIEKNLNTLKMTAWLKPDCYLDLLKSQIQSNLKNKDLILKNYDESSGVWEIILEKSTQLSLVDLLQRQGFLENECNTNDIEPMIMLWCQR